MNLLIILDDNDLSKNIKKVVSSIFDEIVIIQSGQDAIEFLTDHSPAIMLLDYELGDMNAFTLCRELKRNKITIPPFVVTVKKDNNDVALETIKAGAREYIVQDSSFLTRIPWVLKHLIDQIAAEEKRREAESALQEREEQLQRMMLVSNDGMWDWDLRTHVVKFDSRYFKLAGYEPNEFDHRFEEFQKRIHPDDLQLVMDTAADYIQGKIDKFLVEFRFQTKAGGWLWIQGRGVIVERDEHGTPIRFVGTHTNIHERKKAENDLKQSEEKFRTLFENAPVMIQSYDLSGKCLLWNKECEKVLGWTKEEALAEKNMLAVLYPDRKKRKNAIEMIQKADGKFREYAAQTKDGSLCYEMFADFKLPNGEHIGVGYDITEQKLNQIKLKNSEERYRNIVEFSPDGIITMNKRGMITSANKAFVDMTGYEKNEVLDIHFTKLPTFIHQNFSTYYDLFSKVIKNDLVSSLEVKWKNNKGQIRIGEAKTRILQEDGKKSGIQAIIRDITDKKQQQDVIRESELKYRRLIQHSSDAIYVLAGSRFEMINPKFTELFGYTTKELLDPKFNFMQLIHPNSQDHIRNRADKVAAGQKVKPSYEFTALHKNGTELECEVNVSYIRFNGKPATQGIVRDISERKRKEMELRKLSQAVEQSPVSVLICDLAGNIEYVNQTFLNVSGYSQNEVIGKNPRFLNAGDTPVEIFIEMWETIINGNEWKGRLHNKKKNGDLFWEQVTISPIMNDKGEITHYLGLKEDITDKLKLEDRFQQSQKMEAVGLLAGGIAHDFNNLLTVINGYSEFLLEDQVGDKDTMDKIREVRKAGERAAALTRQLLAFSRKQILKPKIVNLNDLVENMQKMVRRLIGENIEFSIFYDTNLKNIFADPGQVEQILLNLIVNARDALPNGGNITVETKQAYLDESYCQLSEGLKPGEHAIVSITDNGIGMSAEIQEHIFEPFFTTKSVEKGTGLGLSTVFGIIRQSGGDIHVYSKVGMGSTFKLILPTIDKVENAVDKEKIKLKGGKETILVVEDELAVKRLVENSLISLGYHVISADNGVEAIKKAKKHKKAIHLLLTDVVMPHMSGKELSTELLKINENVKVCFMSGYTDIAIFQHEILQKDLNFIQKPFTRYALAKTIRNILDS